jgi:hypothetical protein
MVWKVVAPWAGGTSSICAEHDSRDGAEACVGCAVYRQQDQPHIHEPDSTKVRYTQPTTKNNIAHHAVFRFSAKAYGANAAARTVFKMHHLSAS